MRDERRFALRGLFALALCSVPASSRAQLMIASAPDAPIAHAELAYAAGDGPPVTWIALRLASGPLSLVAALPARARAEPGLDAWLAALQDCDSPKITSPGGAGRCRGAPGYVAVEWPRGEGEAPSELELKSAADVAAALEQQGLELPGELPEAERYVVWSWPATDRERTTRTLRIVGGSAPLALRPGPSFPLSVSALTRGPRRLPDEVGNAELDVTFNARGTSDYLESARRWLQTRPEPLLESRSRSAVFDWSIVADKITLRSLASSYALAAARERSDVDADACARELAALRRAETAGAPACGDALDFVLALSATGASEATLQRWLTSAERGFDSEWALRGGEPQAPVLRAKVLDGADCEEEPPPIVVDPPPPVTTGRPGPASPPGTITVVGQETVVVEEPRSEVGCGSSPGPDPYYDDRDTVACSSDTSGSSGDDGCASDTSSSSAGDDGCASDTSSSSAGDDGCASDTSDSSAGDGCASDTSGSADGDASCSGSSEGSRDDGSSCSGGSEESSYDGDTCTGSAAAGAEPEQKLAAGLRARPRRLKTSLWSLALSAVALPIRRRNRRRI